jgi:sensor histidine kinase regulating citrate/malate metabolism
MPLNVIADVFELLRLNIAQKYKISKSIEHKNQALIDLITIERSYEELNNHHNTFKHDLANNLFKSKLNLQRANTLLNKENFEADKLKMTLKRALQAQEVASDFFNQSRKIKEFSLKDFFDRISDLFEIKVILKTDMLDKIRFNTVDFNNIFTNLIKNAQEATSHSKETWVKVYFEHCEKSKAYKFKVIDSGDFNKIKNKERIFEEGVSSKGISDRGLGLYSVRKIIKKYNGEIVLESVNNHTCFSFSLETTI